MEDDDRVLDLSTEAEVDLVHRTDSRTLLVMAALLSAGVFSAWLFRVKKIKYLHETGASVILGIIVGGFIELTDGGDYEGEMHPAVCNSTLRAIMERNHSMKHELLNVEKEAVFDPELFFFLLLPPIIFHAGFSLKNREFGRNIGSILWFALLGTAIATFMTGGLTYLYALVDKSVKMNLHDCLLFGALISTTDPVTTLAVFNDLSVDPFVYALVFGESVLNDAMAIVLYDSIESKSPTNPHAHGSVGAATLRLVLVFTGSVAVGALVGMVSAIFFKFTNIKKYTMLETPLFMLLSYSSYLIGEATSLSGIPAVLICGIAQAHYTLPNLSETARLRASEVTEFFNFLAENFIFSYVGLNFFTFKCHRWNTGFLVWSLIVVVVSRVANIVPISYLLNNTVRRNSPYKIILPTQEIMVWAGLRGAVSFALAMRNTSTPAHQIVLSTTLFIIVFTIMVFGGPTVEVLQYLRIRIGVPHDEGADTIDESAVVSNTWMRFDQAYVRPVLTVMENTQGTDSCGGVLATIKNCLLCRQEQVLFAPLAQSDTDDTTQQSSSSTSETEFLESDKVQRIFFSGELR